MKFRALVLAATAITSLPASAFAADGTEPSGVTALATSAQHAVIALDVAAPRPGSNMASDVSASGLVNLQQNTGANSILQSANTLSAILDCNCAHADTLTAEAKTSQSALILANITVRTPYGGQSLGQPSNSAPWARGPMIAASNSMRGFSGNGLINLTQNTGSNSVLQASNTVAEIRGNASGAGSTLLFP